MVSARTANGVKAEHLTADYWLLYTDTDRRDLIKVADGYEIGTVNFEMWRVGGSANGPDPSFVPIAHANRYYNRSVQKPEWHISDEGKFWDRSTPYVRDLKEILTIRAENHAEADVADRARRDATAQAKFRVDQHAALGAYYAGIQTETEDTEV